jgi:hypothetical protein
MSQEERMRRFLHAVLPLVAFSSVALAQPKPRDQANPLETVAHLKDFPVVELRRYTIKPGEREHFAAYFDTYFPETLEQAGTLVFGEFFERKNPSGFTWIRGFHSTDDRAIDNAIFYYGPVWKEYRAVVNNLLVNTDNVLLLRPLTPEQTISILPAVDPVLEPKGAEGVVVAQIFQVKPDSVDAFVQLAEASFAAYRAAGAREAGVLVTLDVPNNFSQLPVRTDGPFLVWLGILKDNQVLETQFNPVAVRTLRSLSATGLLKSGPETVILDPSRRSRLRWLSTN